MRKTPLFRVADERDNLSLWERCRLIVEAGIRKYGDAGGLPISGTGKARKKKIDQKPKKKSVKPPTTNRNEDKQLPADGPVVPRKSDGKRKPRT